MEWDIPQGCNHGSISTNQSICQITLSKINEKKLKNKKIKN